MPQTQITPEDRMATPLTPQHIPRRRTTAAPAQWNCHSPRSPPRVAPRAAPRAVSPPTSPPGDDGDDNEIQQLSFAIQSSVFRVDADSGRVSVLAAEHDFERQRVYRFSAIVTDDGPGRMSTMASVTVRLIDVNEGPRMAPCQRSVAENAEGGETAGPPCLGSDVDADDEEGALLNYTATGSNEFEIIPWGARRGQVLVAIGGEGRLNFESVHRYDMLVTVSDTVQQTATADLTVEIRDVNERPSLPTTVFDVYEGEPYGTFVGDLDAFDEDCSPLCEGDNTTDAVLTYSLGSGKVCVDGECDGNVGDAFVLSASSGVLRVERAESIDFEH